MFILNQFITYANQGKISSGGADLSRVTSEHILGFQNCQSLAAGHNASRAVGVSS